MLVLWLSSFSFFVPLPMHLIVLKPACFCVYMFGQGCGRCCAKCDFVKLSVCQQQSVTSRLETSRYRDFSQFFEYRSRKKVSVSVLKIFSLKKKSRYRSRKKVSVSVSKTLVSKKVSVPVSKILVSKKVSVTT